MCKMINFLVGIILTTLTASASAQQPPCPLPNHPGCTELVVINAAWDPSNPIMKGLDGRATDGLDRQQRMRDLGPQIWHAQHAGKVSQAGETTYLVFIWNSNQTVTDAAITGIARKVDKSGANRIVPENVTGKVKATELSGYGAPDRVYRIRATGISVSLQFPWEMIGPKSAIIVCEEGKLGIYPNKITANQGHFISPETLASLKAEGSKRLLMPFLLTAK